MAKIHPAVAQHAMEENERLRGLLDRVVREVGRTITSELRADIDATLSQQAEPVRSPGTEDTASMDSNSAQEQFTAVDMATAAAQGFRDGQAAVEPVPVQDEQYPPCDFCGVIPDHHPWHGSGMFKGFDSPHIHACNDCRHLLPSRPAHTEQQATVKECLTVQPMAYAVFAANGNVACFSTQRDHPSLVALEADGHSVVSLAPIAQTEQQPLFFINPLVIDELKGKRKPSPGGLTWSRTACGHWTFAVYAAPIAQTAPQPEQSGLVEALERASAFINALTVPQTKEQAAIQVLDAAVVLQKIGAALSAQGAGDADS